MKKISMFLAAAAAVVMSSCGSSSTPKATLGNGIDSLCYAYGMDQANGFNEFAFSDPRGMCLDSAYQNELIKGIIDGANLGGSDSKQAYYAGVAIGQQLRNNVNKGLAYRIFGDDADSTQVVSLNDFMAGFIAAIKGDSTIMSPSGVREFITVKMNEIKAKAMEAQYGEYRKQNEEYMKKIAKADSVQALGGGVYYKCLVQGNGAIPTLNDRVKVHYEGKTIDGSIFDSSYTRGEPIELGCSQVIKGWTDALTHMPVGSKWILYIPSEAGYGAQDQGPIKPFSTLIFTVELLDIVKQAE